MMNLPYKPLRRVAAAALVCVVIAGSACAQRPGRRPQPDRRPQAPQAERPHDRRGPGNAGADRRRDDRRQNRPFSRAAVLARSLRSLDLSREQQQRIRQIQGRYDERMRTVGQRLREGRRVVDEMLFGPNGDVDRARATARELSVAAGEQVRLRTQVEYEVFGTLAPEQRVELRNRRDRFSESVRAGRERRQSRRAERRRRMAPGGDSPDGQAPPSDLDDGPEPDDFPHDGPDDMDDPEGEPQEPAGRDDRGIDRRRRKAGGGRVIEALGLTPEQQSRFHDERRQRATTLRALNVRFREAQRAVDDALLSESIDSVRIGELGERLGQIVAEREMARFESEAAIRAILTPQQLERFRAIRIFRRR